jgi:hypothetical protein
LLGRLGLFFAVLASNRRALPHCDRNTGSEGLRDEEPIAELNRVCQFKSCDIAILMAENSRSVETRIL